MQSDSGLQDKKKTAMQKWEMPMTMQKLPKMHAEK